MKKVLRREANADYWDRRWSEADRDRDRFEDLTIYPIRYAEMVMTDRTNAAVELGAGLGRLLKHYHYSGYRIAGLERSEVAVSRLKAEDSSLDVRVGDVTRLPFEACEFDVVLAFGLFHNIEQGMEEALAETARCLMPGGRFCISMRPHNVEMLVNEWYWKWKNRRRSGRPSFHKWLVGAREFEALLSRYGLETTNVEHARNVSLLYRIPVLRASSADESERRAKGYRLNRIGGLLDRALVRLFPSQFCNVLVFIGRKVDNRVSR